MVRGTFANVRLRNLLVPEARAWTVHCPTARRRVFEAAERYRAEASP